MASIRRFAVLAAALAAGTAYASPAVPFDVDETRSYFAACVSLVDFPAPPLAVRVLADGTLTIEFGEFAPIPGMGESPITVRDVDIEGTQEVPQVFTFENTTITSIETIATTGRVEPTGPGMHQLVLEDVNLAFATDVSIRIEIPPFPPIVIGPLHFDTLILDGGQFPVPDANVPIFATGGGPCTLGAPCGFGNDGGLPVPTFEEVQAACNAETLCAEGDLCLASEISIPVDGDVITFDFQAKLVARATSTEIVPPTADVILENGATGDFAMWLTLGATVQAEAGGPLFEGWEFLAAGDFDDDGDTDALFRDTETDGVCVGEEGSALVVAVLDGNEIQGFDYLGCVPAGYAFEAAGDVDGDGGTDLVMRVEPPALVAGVGETAEYRAWMLAGGDVVDDRFITGDVPPTVRVEGVGRLDGDANPDLLVSESTANALYLLPLDATSVAAGPPDFIDFLPAGARVVGTGDVGADGDLDAVIEYPDGTTRVEAWLLDGGNPPTRRFVENLDPGDRAVALADFNADGGADVLIEDASLNALVVTYLGGSGVLSLDTFMRELPAGFEAVAANP